LNQIKILREYKADNGVSSYQEVDALIGRLRDRAQNFIRATNNLGSPIALDLNGDGKIGTHSVANGVQFDMDGNGSSEQTSWISSEDGLLVLDRNNNGIIDSGKELFGN